MSSDERSAGPLYVFNGPSNLKDLEHANLRGARLVFNGPFNLQDLRRGRLAGATIYINGRHIIENLNPVVETARTSAVTSSPRSEDTHKTHRSRADRYPERSIDSYRPSLDDPNPGNQQRNTRRPSIISKSSESRPHLPTVVNPKAAVFYVGMAGMHHLPKGRPAPLPDYTNDPNRLSPVGFSDMSEAGEIREITNEAKTAQNWVHPDRMQMVPSENARKRNASTSPLGRNRKMKREYESPTPELGILDFERPGYGRRQTGANCLPLGDGRKDGRSLFAAQQKTILHTTVRGGQPHLASERESRTLPALEKDGNSLQETRHLRGQSCNEMSQADTFLNSLDPIPRTQVNSDHDQRKKSALEQAEMQYYKADLQLRRERQALGRARPEAVHRVKVAGRVLARLHEGVGCNEGAEVLKLGSNVPDSVPAVDPATDGKAAGEETVAPSTSLIGVTVVDEKLAERTAGLARPRAASA